MWSKLLAANVTEAISEKSSTAGSPPSLHDVEGFLANAQTAPKSATRITGSVQLVAGESDLALYTESRRVDGNWVHRKYVAK
jgi:hypothetical protein